jgi:hypothetical protein
MIDQKSKFIFALMQIENISELLEQNEYEQFFASHLIPIKIELERQLTNLNHSLKIEE